MYKGKKKCKILKEIRAEIAKNNGIDYVIEECRHKGDCKGTCPKCEAEVRMLEAQLAERARLGKRVVLVGVAAGIALTASACGPDTTADVQTSNSSANTSTVEIPAGAPLPETETMTLDVVDGEIAVPTVTPGEVPVTEVEQGDMVDDAEPTLQGTPSIETEDDEQVTQGTPTTEEDEFPLGGEPVEDFDDPTAEWDI